MQNLGSTREEIFYYFLLFVSGFSLDLNTIHPIRNLSCILHFLSINCFYNVEMYLSLLGVSHLGLAKLANCNQILHHIAGQNYIAFIDLRVLHIRCEI